jgi:hypothetical protein
MSLCGNLDHFYDVVFHVDNSLIKGNSTILKARSSYFEAMLSDRYCFSETISNTYVDKETNQQFRVIKVEGIKKVFFNCIVQYLYSDHFYIYQYSIEFFIQLLIYADYFMLPRI